MAQGFGQRSSGEGDRPVARWWPAWQEREKESLESSAVEGERATEEVGSERRRDTWLWWRRRGEGDDGAGFVLPLAEKGGAHTRRPWQRWAGRERRLVGPARLGFGSVGPAAQEGVSGRERGGKGMGRKEGNFGPN
uniref:Uncharacterized protein n=1 Tax=Oryza barthii TaxID=65489 RepID=A0A0D3HST7_9ORYZ